MPDLAGTGKLNKQVELVAGTTSDCEHLCKL